MNKEKQEVYINLDDSGKLTKNEQISIYGGIVFTSKKEKDKFITQYRSILKDIQCKYCYHNNNCNKKCPEIKNTNIKPGDKRRIMNYIKKYFVISLIIRNDKVYKHIITNKAAKGRFTDYGIRRLIKEVIIKMIELKIINPYIPLRININIDEQSTKSNGYYNLKDGLIEELKYGIINYDYAKTIKPIIKNKLDISLIYQDSGKCYTVQASDLIAGTVRREVINKLTNSNEIEVPDMVDLKLIIP